MKTSERKQKKGINKDRNRINDIENRKTIKKINEIKSRYFEEINKIDKTLKRLTEKKKGYTNY